MLLTAMHDNPNQGFWQANAKNNPPAIIKEIRIKRATQLIETGEFNMTQISLSLMNFIRVMVLVTRAGCHKSRTT